MSTTWLMTFPEDKASLPVYSAWAKQFCDEVVALSPKDAAPEDLSGFAGLLLTGGGDVEPARYGDTERHEKTYGVDPLRDALELGLIPRFIDAGKPIFGICRGLQILVTYFGGRLIQHVPDTIGIETECHRVPKGYDCFHPLLADGGTQLGEMLRGVDETNSAHHQAMDTSVTPRLLRVAARSGCGVIEAVETFELAAPVAAVQWHPERLPIDHPASSRLIDFLRGPEKVPMIGIPA